MVEVETEAETETEAGAGAETGAETEAEAGAEAEAEADTWTEAEAEAEAETEAEAEAEAGAEVEVEAEPSKTIIYVFTSMFDKHYEVTNYTRTHTCKHVCKNSHAAKLFHYRQIISMETRWHFKSNRNTNAVQTHAIFTSKIFAYLRMSFKCNKTKSIPARTLNERHRTTCQRFIRCKLGVHGRNLQ